MAQNNIIFQKYSLSKDLEKIIETKEKLPISEIVKKVWKYIKDNDLQNPKDRRFILSDEKLKKIFPEEFLGFSMMKHIKQYIKKDELKD